MSTRYAVLLRGVNVGGVTVRSADLRAALEAAGFDDVRTVLASGNALVGDADGAGSADVRSRAEAALLVRFDREVRVVVRSQVELTAIADACPYPGDSETHHAYVVLFDDTDAATTAFATVAGVAGARTDGSASSTPAADTVDEAVTAGDGVVYWWCPRGSSLATPVSKAVERFSRTTLTTTRNLRTLARLTSG